MAKTGRAWTCYGSCCCVCTGSTSRKAQSSTAAFSLCLSLCHALEPEDIRASVKLFPRLDEKTLHWSCFFDAKSQELMKAPVAAIVGNPPFESSLTTEGAKQSHKVMPRRIARWRTISWPICSCTRYADFEPGGILAMVEPAVFLYNQNALSFRRTFF